MYRMQVKELIWDKETRRFIEDFPAKVMTGGFIMGPLPEQWLVLASQLPGKALEVGLCLWKVARMTKRMQVRIGSDVVERWGIGRMPKARALRALQNAGLIRIDQERGKLGLITLIPTR
jgi:hypothetical protein